MRPAYAPEAVREAERAELARLPAGALMQRAAVALARRCAALLPRVYGARVVLLVGGGDNGGDALYAGALLARRGARVDAVAVAERRHEPGALAARAAGVAFADPASLSRLLAGSDLVVDGMVGIGARGALRGGAADAARELADCAATVVAVDVPSGVDAATGEVAGAAVRADVTVTFGVLKPGLVVDPGAGFSGAVECVDIGVGGRFTAPPELAVLEAADVAAALPVPARHADKYRRGVLGVLAGSDAFPGAAVLAVGGALAAGCGMVRYVGPPEPAALVRAAWPEAVCTVSEARDAAALERAGRVQAWVVGPGIGTDPAAAAALRAVLASDVPVLVDADATSILAREGAGELRRSPPTLLTPHAGEFARLAGVERAAVEAAPLRHVRELAHRSGAVVLLKGPATLVAAPDGTTYANPTGTPWLATAGSGDVLSGAAGALLAGGVPPALAGAAAAFLHGLAGRLAAEGGASVRASELVSQWSAAVRAVRA